MSLPGQARILSAVTASPEETVGLAARLGRRLRPGQLVALDGPLGAGKTVFVRGLAQGRGVDPLVVRSPSFVLHHVYGSPPQLHHLDLYRLPQGAAIAFLDLDILLETAPVAVEWGERADLGTWHPLHLVMDITGDVSRRIEARQLELASDVLVEAWSAALAG